MKELTDILLAFDRLPAGADAAMATVVRVVGSAYRSPGARLLIGPDGAMTGQVSGGCLERDVVRRAGGVMAAKKPIIVRYETGNDPGGDGGNDTGDDAGSPRGSDCEAGTGISLGCGGAIDILIEPLNTPAGLQLMHWLAQSRSARCVLATVISKRHPRLSPQFPPQFPLGWRMAVDALRPEDQAIDDPSFMQHIDQTAREMLGSNPTRIATVPSLQGGVEILFEALRPPTELLIFGAGNDAVPLAAMGRSLGWRVTVVDVGSAPPDSSRAWSPDRIIRCGIGQVDQLVKIAPETAAVVMTHNFGHDRKLLRWLATQPLKYLGMLGPRHRTDQLLGDLRIESLRAPVGLDIGAETPEEVALSIAAEITASMRGRDGRPLSTRPGPIHVRTSAE